jgi:ATP-dependent DNA helicase PIF1
MQDLPYTNLSVEQRYALHQFRKGGNMFLTGAGGTGKTQLIKCMVADALRFGRCSSNQIQVCALTGCATILLNMKARTIHSWSGIRVAHGTKEQIINDVFYNDTAVNNWRSVKVLIIDEVSMMSKKIFEILEELGRRVRHSMAPFGGIQVVCSGDFYQLPPVGSRDEPDTCRFCFESSVWNSVFPLENYIELKTIFRQKDPVYCAILNEVRIGRCSPANQVILHDRVGLPVPDGVPITKVFPIKKKVENMNQEEFAKLTTPMYGQSYIVKRNCKRWLDKILPFDDETKERCRRMTPKEADMEIKMLMSNIPADEHFYFKVGAMVMLTFNMSVESGLCNGSTGVIEEIRENQKVEGIDGLIDAVPYVRFRDGQLVRIPPHFWQSNDYPCLAIGQFPLILAWAVTIHKTQGSTLDMAEVDAGTSIFECGQTYVGLSRVRSLDGLFLTNFHPKSIKTHPTVVDFYGRIAANVIDYSAIPPLDAMEATIIDEAEEEAEEDNNVRTIAIAVPVDSSDRIMGEVRLMKN